MPQDLGPNQLKWVEALESGCFTQGEAALCMDGEYCCLGVACEVFRVEKIPDTEEDGTWCYGKQQTACVAPEEVVALLALRSESGAIEGEIDDRFETLIGANDNARLSFPEIASVIRQHPEAVFTEPR